MQIALVSLTVVRDAMTRLPASVPAHEVEIMKTVHGEDNVTVNDGDAGFTELDPANEGDRLVAKYGEDVVKRVLGENYKGAAARACSSHEVNAKSKGKALASA